MVSGVRGSKADNDRLEIHRLAVGTPECKQSIINEALCRKPKL